MTRRLLVLEIEADEMHCCDCINLDWPRAGEVWCCLFPAEEEAATRLDFDRMTGGPLRCRNCLDAEQKP